MNVLISGSSSGIGRATAKAFAATGDRVFAGMRCPDDAKPIPDAEVIPLDVNDPSSVTRAVAITADTAGTIDVLINNAGVAACASIEATDDEIFRTILETNLLGVHRLTREVLPHMRRQGGGHIVNVSSLNGRVAVPYVGAYSASKFALEGLSETLALELTGTSIFVTLIEPGVFKTSIDDKLVFVEDSPNARTAASIRRAMADNAPPVSEVAEAILAATRTNPPPFRVPVGADAVELLAARRDNDDEQFAKLLRPLLGLT